MNSTVRMQTLALTVALATVVCIPASAHRGHRHDTHVVKVVKVAPAPARPAVVVTARPDRQQRLDMAVAYLGKNLYLTVGSYAKLTGLTHDMAKAELDAFARNMANPIKMVTHKNRVRYVLR